MFPESLSHSSSDIRDVTRTDTSHPNYKVVLISQFTDVWTSVSGFAINFLFVLKDFCVIQTNCRLDRFSAFGRSCNDAQFEIIASRNRLHPELLWTSEMEI
jgi:hypothetical protein